MCLTVIKGAKVAESDIGVYKVVSTIPGDRRWYPLYFGHNTGRGFGEVCHETGKPESGMPSFKADGAEMVDVEDGFFHSTQSLRRADFGIRKTAERMSAMRGREILICEAVIPAGTRYYTDGVDYASERIIVKDR